MIALTTKSFRDGKKHKGNPCTANTILKKKTDPSIHPLKMNVNSLGCLGHKTGKSNCPVSFKGDKNQESPVKND